MTLLTPLADRTSCAAAFSSTEPVPRARPQAAPPASPTARPAVAAAPTPVVAANVPATSPAMGARAAAPLARTPGIHPKAPPSAAAAAVRSSHFAKKEGVRAGRPAPGRASQRARQEARRSACPRRAPPSAPGSKKTGPQRVRATQYSSFPEPKKGERIFPSPSTSIASNVAHSSGLNPCRSCCLHRPESIFTDWIGSPTSITLDHLSKIVPVNETIFCFPC